MADLNRQSTNTARFFTCFIYFFIFLFFLKSTYLTMVLTFMFKYQFVANLDVCGLFGLFGVCVGGGGLVIVVWGFFVCGFLFVYFVVVYIYIIYI